jgi:hypothetical protein
MCHRLSLLALVVFMVCSVSGVEGQEFVTDGLVSFWTFDRNTISGDTVEDVWGNNNGKVTDAQIAAGKINEGLEFNGSSSLVTIEEDKSLDITDAMSIEAWIKMSAWQADPNRNVIMARYDQDQNKRYLQFSINPDNGLAAYMGYSNGTAYFQTQKGGTNRDWIGEWVHVAFTWDYSDGGLAKLYVNGEEIGSYQDQQALEEPLVPYNIPWIIGAMPPQSRYFAGVIDEVRIYNKRLSDEEIKRNFNVKSNNVAVQPAGKLATTWSDVKVCRRAW